MIATAQEPAGPSAPQFFVLVSYLEIYNEVIKDLLNPSDKQLKIREHPDMGIYVVRFWRSVVSRSAVLTRLWALLDPWAG